MRRVTDGDWMDGDDVRAALAGRTAFRAELRRPGRPAIPVSVALDMIPPDARCTLAGRVEPHPPREFTLDERCPMPTRGILAFEGLAIEFRAVGGARGGIGFVSLGSRRLGGAGGGAS